MRFASPQPDEMRADIRDRLRRRLSAPKRIGCPYRLAAFSTAPGFDRLNLPQATRLQPMVRRVSPGELQPVPLRHRSGISKRVMIIVKDP